MVEEELLENMLDEMNEYNTKALKAKGYHKNIYAQKASQLKKMVTQIQHRQTIIQEKSLEERNINCELISYLLYNNLITEEKLDKIKDIARQKSKESIAIEEKIIKNIYGSYENEFSNKSNSDPTANAVINNARR
jgi:hypothetical protein